MHFWIDKRSSQCGYNRRPRVPSSLSAEYERQSSHLGVGRPRGRVGLEHKNMAAPVHRFAALDPPPRRLRNSHRNRNNSLGGRRANQVHSVQTPPLPAAPTIASLAAARSVTPDTLLRTAALGLHQQSPVIAPHLKFGMMVSFALATMFIAGAKFYFDRQAWNISTNSGGGGGGSGGAVVVAAGGAAAAAGALAACRRARLPAPPTRTPLRVSSTGARRPHSIPDTSEDISLTIITEPPPSTDPSPSGSEGPPPYHIAVLLPLREAAPPSYGELGRVS